MTEVLPMGEETRYSVKEAAERWKLQYGTLQRKIWYDNEHGRPLHGTRSSKFYSRSWEVTEKYMIENYGPAPEVTK